MASLSLVAGEAGNPEHELGEIGDRHERSIRQPRIGRIMVTASHYGFFLFALSAKETRKSMCEIDIAIYFLNWINHMMNALEEGSAQKQGIDRMKSVLSDRSSR
jgi:hypothetical protein